MLRSAVEEHDLTLGRYSRFRRGDERGLRLQHGNVVEFNLLMLLTFIPSQ